MATECRPAVYHAPARSILSRTSGFIARAGFTHSLTPARNCVFGCTYCYVPTLRLYGGLQPADWKRWGQHTTFKSNADKLLRRELRPSQSIYCSPLVDPYQPAERAEQSMPAILDALCDSPPSVFVLQTRSALVLRDIRELQRLAALTTVRVSFSLTTDREDIRRLYEPHCDSVDDRVQAMQRLSDGGLAVSCTLAPILPCNPLRLADLALACTTGPVIADPLHSRAGKPFGATTRPEGMRVSEVRGFEEWHSPPFQETVLGQIRGRVESAGRLLGVGEAGFRLLTD